MTFHKNLLQKSRGWSGDSGGSSGPFLHHVWEETLQLGAPNQLVKDCTSILPVPGTTAASLVAPMVFCMKCNAMRQRMRNEHVYKYTYIYISAIISQFCWNSKSTEWVRKIEHVSKTSTSRPQMMAQDPTSIFLLEWQSFWMDCPDCPDRAPENVRLCEIFWRFKLQNYIICCILHSVVIYHFVQTPDGLELSVNSLPHLIIVLSPDPPVHS